MYSVLLLVGSILLQIPDPIPPIDPLLKVPVGPLPWSLPQFPVVEIDTGLSVPSISEVGHGDDYNDNITAIDDRLTAGGLIETDAEIELGDWIGPDANIPDISTEDWNTGIDLPEYENMTALDVAAELGENIGTLFANVRSLTTIDLDLGGTTLAVAFVILCIAWILLLKSIIFAIQLADMVFSVLSTLIEMIPFAE